MSTETLEAGASTQQTTAHAASVQSGQQNASTATGSPATGASVTSAAVEPWYKDWLQSDGKLNASAYDRLPEDLKHLKPSLERYGTAENFLRVFDNQMKLAGKKALAPLPDNAPPEVVAERNQLLRSINGVPEKPDGYGIKKPDDLPDAAWNQEHAAAAMAIMHKHNISPKAAAELVALQTAEAKKQLAAQDSYAAQFFAEQDKQIRAGLQGSGINYDQANELAKRGAAMFGIDPADPIMKNAKVFLAMTRAATAISEDKFVSGQSGGAKTMSDAQLAQDIISNKANPEHAAYWNPLDANNKAVKAKVQALMAAAHAKK